MEASPKQETVTENLVALYKALGGGWEAEDKTN
jgi:outer membrane protein TolC